MQDVNKYVLVGDYERDKGKIYGRINEVDNKHVNLNNNLRLIVTTLSNNTEALTKTSENTNKIIERIDDKMDGYNDRIKNVEFNVETTEKRIDDIEGTMSERKRGNAKIWVAIITTTGGFAGSALGLAQLFS